MCEAAQERTGYQIATLLSGETYSLSPGLDVERLIPCINVRYHAIDAKSSRRVVVAHQLVSKCFVAKLSLQDCAYARKKRWSPVYPSITKAGSPCSDR
jgi:hypothetical protein